MFSTTSFYVVGVPLDRKWLHAKVHLGMRVVRHFLRKLWPWAPRFGLERFEANYVAEGLPPFSPEHRSLAAEAGRCTACGACDEACPILAGRTTVAEDAFAGPQAFIVAGARSSPHLDDLVAALDTLTGPVCAGCRTCDRVCPESIPIAALAAALQGQRHAVTAARSGTLPVVAADVPLRAAAARALSTAATTTTKAMTTQTTIAPVTLPVTTPKEP